MPGPIDFLDEQVAAKPLATRQLSSENSPAQRPMLKWGSRNMPPIFSDGRIRDHDSRYVGAADADADKDQLCFEDYSDVTQKLLPSGSFKTL